MRAVDIIMKKRFSPHEELSKEELEFFIGGYVKGEIPDYQVSAWLMAVCFNGMSFAETKRLTEIMLHSGETIDLKGLKGPFVDKHSTGGVGDKISLPLAPIVACCGIQIPMMSGRALGHTGGTLDKLDSITGYKTNLSVPQLRTIMEQTGFAMTGQTKEIVPADRLLYSLRDVTATVESIPLITASILSKKMAEGSEALVFDVKWGCGAFMKTPEEAEKLAESLVKTTAEMGKKACALITDMNTPLGNTVGNFLEIEETMDCLEGKGPADTTELTYAFGSWMIMLGGKASSFDEGVEMCKKAVSSGKAMECFLNNVKAQGGDVQKLLSDRGTRRSPYHTVVKAQSDGYITTIDAFKTGIAGVNLGVGRNRTDEAVFADAGIIFKKQKGDVVKKDDVIMEVYGKNEQCFANAIPLLEQALTIGTELPKKTPLICKEITAL